MATAKKTAEMRERFGKMGAAKIAGVMPKGKKKAKKRG